MNPIDTYGSLRVLVLVMPQAYMSTYFPREVKTGSANVLDAEQTLRMAPESEKFLRILIDMWLERNSITSPESKPNPRATDEENTLSGEEQYHPPTPDVLHGAIIVVTHLLSRKIQVDLITQLGSRVARPSLSCPALDALSQPVFNFLATTFRQIKVTIQYFFLEEDKARRRGIGVKPCSLLCVPPLARRVCVLL